METLIPLSKSVKLRRHMLKSIIKRKYNSDRNKLVEAKNYLIGDTIISQYTQLLTIVGKEKKPLMEYMSF